MEYFISLSSRYETSDCVRLTLWLFEKRLSETCASRSITLMRKRVSPFASFTYSVNSRTSVGVTSSTGSSTFISLIIVSRISESCTIEMILNSSSLSL